MRDNLSCSFSTGVICEVFDFYTGRCSPLDIQIEYCSPQSRAIDVCHTVYSPVCGVDNRDRETSFTNSCEACKDSSIQYYRLGEC